MLAAQYQSQQSSKSILFQDRIRVARRCFETGITNWKKEAVETLEVLDGKRYSEGSVSTVLTTASFSADNYKLALELFDEFSISRPDTSFPQTLFRRLQGVSEDNRTRYLLKAAGTNGLRAAKMIDEDKRRETLKALATSSCECEWESLGDDVTSRLMNYPESSGLSAPSFISPWIFMNSDDPATTFQVLSHGFGVTPVKVEVQVMSPTTGFIYPGVKSAFAGNDDNERGGIVYLYNDNDIKLYGATNAGTELGTAYIIFTGMTFWTADNQEKSKTGYVRVRAWHPNDLPSPSFTATLNMKAGNVVWNDYEERNHALGILPVLTVVQYSPAFSGTLYGWTAEGQGSSSRPVGNPNLYWGGLIYAVSNEDIRMWAPASGQANYGIFSFCDGWGWDVRGSDCSYIRAAVTIRMWTNLLASEEVNVTDPHDVGEANGTHEINLLPPYTIDVDNDIVTVAAISIGGSNPGFLFYGSGAAMVDNADGCGGVVYAYSNVSSSVRIWHPVDGTSGIIHVYGMGGGTYNQISQQAIIEVRLFKVATTTVAVALPPPPPPPTAAPPTSTTTIAAPPTSTTTIAAPPPTTFAPGMTTTTLPSTTPESVVCFNTTIVVNMTTVLRIANDIVVNLTVPAKTTSKYTRSLTSVRDSRRSSTVIGVVGAGICVGVVCLLVIPDVLTLLLFLIRPRHV